MCHANGLQFGSQSQTASLPSSPGCLGGSQGSPWYLLQNCEEERFLTVPALCFNTLDEEGNTFIICPMP